jgi:hypothetical protein
MMTSQSAPLAFDAHAPLDTADYVIGQTIQKSRIEVGDAQRRRSHRVWGQLPRRLLPA